MSGVQEMTPSERREAARAVVARLLQIKEREGSLPASLVRRMADLIGVGERSLWRWVEQGELPGRRGRGYQLPERAIELYFQYAGSVAAVRRQLERDGVPVPSKRTLERAFRKQLSNQERGYAADGEAGRRRFTLYRRREMEHRNQMWEADHMEIPVEVIPPRGRLPKKVWLTVFLDAYSRAVMGWAVSLQPTAAEVLAALQAGILQRADRGPFHGVPQALRWDNGLDFVADSVSSVAARLGCLVIDTQPFAPHLKGKVERFFRTIQDELFRGFARNTNGPRKANGKLYGAHEGALRLEQLVGEVEQWINHYNLERPHSALDGQTPLERWLEDATPLDAKTREELRWLILPRTTRKVLKDGIHFEGLIFFAPELSGLVGETVEVRYMPHDLLAIEIWHEGEFVANVSPQDVLSEDELKRHYKARKEERKRANAMRRRATRRTRARLAPITTAGETTEVTQVSRDAARRESGTRSDVDLRGEARLDLLGLDGVVGPAEQMEGEDDES